MILSESEEQILTLTLMGQTQKKIGTSLHLSERTIRFKTWVIFCKLGARNKAEAFFILGKEGWIPKF